MYNSSFASKGCMNVSVTERVLNRGTYSGAEAEELAIAAGGGLSVHKDNTLEILRERELGRQRQAKDAQKEANLKAKLLQQQENFRKEKATGKGDVEGQGSVERDSTPLPAGWEAVMDPQGSGDYYYWHAGTNVTTWERPSSQIPTAVPSGDTGVPTLKNHTSGSFLSAETSGGGEPGHGREPTGRGGTELPRANDLGSLPEGWKEVKHAATGQICYVHAASGVKRWSRPTIAGDVTSDIQQTRQTHLEAARQAELAQTGAKGGKDGGGKKRGREEIDPLDPTGGRGSGGWTQGLGGGDRMADSTAGGSLWQQRPLPAPGAVLKKQGGGRGAGRGNQGQYPMRR